MAEVGSDSELETRAGFVGKGKGVVKAHGKFAPGGGPREKKTPGAKPTMTLIELSPKSSFGLVIASPF